MALKIIQEGDVFDATGEDTDFNCCKCGKNIDINNVGYACSLDKNIRVFCEKCQDELNRIIDYNASDPICKLALIKNDEHSHIKFNRK